MNETQPHDRDRHPPVVHSLKGVRVHTLQNLDLQLPRRLLAVVTGPRGSGNSSPALDSLSA